MFSDLECDYINPIDLCNKLNQVCFYSCLVASLDRHYYLIVCPARKHSSCFPHYTLPRIWAMGGLPLKRTTGSI
jgi:hypothetical protein